MEKLITIFRIPELRTKILFTLGLLAIYRLGFWVPLPIINQAEIAEAASRTATQGGQSWNQLLSHLALFSGTDLGTATIFGLGIMPYISASIIFQLLSNVVPQLEALRKEGAVGQKKINEYTRYATVAICLLQSGWWLSTFMNPDTFRMFNSVQAVYSEYVTTFYFLVMVIVMTSGTVFLMWIGEQIDEYGIGNGISLIIMAGIIGRLPAAIGRLIMDLPKDAAGNPSLQIAPQEGLGIEKLIILLGLFLAVIVGVVLITQGQRRIPTQSAKHVRGRRVFGGQRQYLPLRVNQAGVMPIIFASSLLIFPTYMIRALVDYLYTFRSPTDTQAQESTALSWARMAAESLYNQGFLYILLYIMLIYFFCYFWVAVTFNPKDIANNLKDYGSFIPGYRPGKRTAEYLERVMQRITYVGAGFLAVVAIIPMMVSSALNVHYMIASFFGGTGLLIIVSVGLDLVQKIDSHLIMRNYDGLVGDDK